MKRVPDESISLGVIPVQIHSTGISGPKIVVKGYFIGPERVHHFNFELSIKIAGEEIWVNFRSGRYLSEADITQRSRVLFEFKKTILKCTFSMAKLAT